MTKQKTDFEKLQIALDNMRANEGKNETGKLMWHSLRASDARVYDMAEDLSEKVRLAQHELGVQNPSCGVKLAAEILAKVGMLMNDAEEG
jgi:hypothetical protein